MTRRTGRSAGRQDVICACGQTNPDGAKFCLECGAAFALRCAGCGTELPAGAKFCLECGQPVRGDTIGAEPREVRKLVTVVFADLAGSTALQEHMDPESVRRVMERFYALMRSEIESAGGIVVKLIGDGVMAGFGIREMREDDALRAVRAGAAMQRAFAAFADGISKRWHANISLRVGINSGEVVVSEEHDDVVGDTVNVAARLEHAAGSGNVLVGDETWRLTRYSVTLEAVTPLELHGKADRVPAYRLVSVDPPRAEDPGAAAFVGRANELRRLQELFDRCAVERSASLLTIVGSPGIGKSRIASHFAASIADRGRILDARCDAAATATYAPIAEALRQAANIAETAAPDQVVAMLEALLPAESAERRRIAQFVASLLGVGDPAPPQETFWAVRRLLEGLADEQPVVLIVDDVQWAEPMLLDLLEHVVEWAKDAGIMIVALARPEIRDSRAALVEAGAIVLDGLGANDTAELASSLLGAHDLPQELVCRILATTDGNPLFVRELLRMLVDDGALRRDNNRWVITVEADEIDVPPTIHALLSARIERLRDDERAVVERASVVGQEFYRGAVFELVPRTVRPGLDGHLETLCRKELVEPEGTYWIDERVFRFHHVLIRDAAYRRLLKEARAELHERFANWLEIKVGDLVGEHEEVLGYHLEQAHTYLRELGSLEDHTVELGRRAASHLAAATRRALHRDDLSVAASLAGRALSLTDEPTACAEILLDRCEALLAMGDVLTAAEAVAELRSLAADDRLAAWADCFAGQLAVLTDAARLRETADLVAGVALRLAHMSDDAGAAKAHAVHAQSLAHLGQFGACEAALDRALAAARAAGDRRRANAVLSSAPLAALWGPSPVARASGRCLDVVRVLRITGGAPAVEATALRCQAVLEAMRGRTDAARRMLGSARNAVEELGLGHALVECGLFAGLVELLAGEPASAETALRAAHDGFRRLNVATDTAQAAALLARALVEQNRDDEALALTEESERFGGDDLTTAIAWRTVRARVLARRGELDAALELARAAVSIAEATDALVDHADARLALADVLAVAGRDDEAAVEQRAGRQLYERKQGTVTSEATATIDPRRTLAANAPRGADPPGVHSAPGVTTGAVITLLTRYRRALMSRDWDAMAELYSHDHVMIDHRSGLRSELTERRAWIDALRATWQDIESEWHFEVLAAWSENLAVARVQSFGQGWARTYLVVVGMHDGVLQRTEIFDEEDHASALARLDELSCEPSAACVTLDRFASTYNDRDWRGFRSVLGDDLTVANHRRLGLLDAKRSDDLVEGMAAMVTVHPNVRLTHDGLAAAGHAALIRGRVGDDGGDMRIDSLIVLDTADERITRLEFFDLDDELGARRRLHALEPSPSFVAWLLQSQFERHARQDWEGLRPLWHPDLSVIDHRPIGWGRLRGVDQVLDFLREGARTAEMAPGSLWITEWLAITGRAALFRYRWAGTSADGVAFSFDRLMVATITDGVVVRVEMFDPDQLDDARRAVNAEGHAAVAAARRVVARARSGDWAGVGHCFADDVVYEDHRSLMRTTTHGRDAIVEAVRYQIDGGDDDLDLDVLEDGGRKAVLVRAVKRKDSAEIVLLIVYAIDEEGRLSYCCLFSTDQLNHARQRLHGIARDDHLSAEGFSDVVTLLRRWEDAFHAGAGPELAALYSPEFEAIEHGHHVALDLTTHLEMMRGVSGFPGATAQRDRIAFLGERHHVNRTTFSFQDDEDLRGRHEATVVTAVRLDHAMRFLRFELFPAELLHRALCRAEELYLEGEAVGDAASGARRRLSLWRMCDAHNDGDWDAFAAALASDLVFVDRRQLGWGVFEGRDAFVDLIRAIGGRSVQHVWRISDVHRVTDTGAVYTLPTEGVDRDGGRYEQGAVVVAIVSDEGVSRLEAFPLRAADEALRRFEELDSSKPGLSNAFTKAYDAWLEAVRRRDWAAITQLQAPDIVLDDRRTGLHHALSGREELIRSQEHAMNLGWELAGCEVVATRGDRLALHRLLWRPQNASEIEMLVVGALDAAARIATRIVFDPDDFASALSELNERYASTLPARQAAIFETVTRSAAAYNDHDWPALASPLAPDASVVDGRLLGWGAFQGVGELDVHLRGQAALIPDVSVIAASVERISDHGILLRIRLGGTDRSGGRVEFENYALYGFRDSEIAHLEFLPTDEPEAAFARFDELTRPSATVERAWERLIAAMNARDLASVDDSHAPTFVMHDQTFRRDFDRREFLISLAETLRTPGSFRHGRLISVGDRHGVIEMIWTRTDHAALEVANWYPMRCDADGRFLVAERYAEEHLLEALARAEELYLEDEASGDDAAASRIRLNLWRAFIADNAGDWATWRSLVDPNLVVVDRSPLGWGDVNSEGVRHRQEALQELTERNHLGVKSVAIDGDVVMVEVVGEGAMEGGGSFEISKWVVQAGARYQEHFAPEQREDAERRFRELVDARREAPTAIDSALIKRSWHRVLAAKNERRFDQLDALLAPEYVVRDHILHCDLDRAETLADLRRVLRGQGSFQAGRTIVLGDRHGVFELTWTMGTSGTVGESSVTKWFVNRCDPDGRFLVTEWFAEAQLVEALERAEGLYLEHEASGADAVASRHRLSFWRSVLAYNSGDWDRLRAALDPSLVTVDHRPAGWGRLEGRDAYLDVIRGLAGMAPHRSWAIRSIELEASTVLVEIDVVGEDADGGSFVLPFISVVDLGDDGWQRMDLFVPEQRDDAMRRYRSASKVGR